MKLPHKWLSLLLTLFTTLLFVFAFGQAGQAATPAGASNTAPDTMQVTNTKPGVKANQSAQTPTPNNQQVATNQSQVSAQPTNTTSQQNSNSQTFNVTTGKGATAAEILASEPEHVPRPVHPIITGITVVNANTGLQVDEHTQLTPSTPLTITVRYDCTGTNIYPGDYFHFSLSGMGYNGNTSFYSNQGRVDLENGNGTFTFTTSPASDAKGSFYFTAQLDTTGHTDGQTVPISVSVDDHTQFTGHAIYTAQTGTSPNEVFSKYSMNSDLTRGNIGYAIRINPTGTHSFPDGKVTDRLSTPGFTYDRSSFRIEEVKWTWNGTDWDNRFISNVPVTPVFSDNDTAFEIDFGNRITNDGNGYLILYNLLYNGNPVNEDSTTAGKIVYNNAQLSDNRGTVTHYDQTLRVVNAGGSGTARTVTAVVKKVWNDNINHDHNRPSTLRAYLLANGQRTGRSVLLSEATGWTGRIDGLLRYDDNNNLLSYTWSEDPVTGYNGSSSSTVNGDGSVFTTTLTNSEQPPISLTVTKVWNDADNQDGMRPASINVNLMNGNTIVRTVTLSEGNHWSTTVNNLPEYRDGQKINYNWQEVNVPGYTSTSRTTQNSNGTSTTILTNTYLTNITVNKAWNDANNQDDLRPSSIKVNLMNGSQIVQTVTLTAQHNWTATVDNLPKYNNGHLINYTWDEPTVPSGYTKAIDGNKITNTHSPTVSETIRKVWSGSNNQDGKHPDSVTVHLMNGNTVVDTTVLKDSNKWTTTFNNLPEYHNGHKINYTWKEDNVPDYTATISTAPNSQGTAFVTTLTNSYTPDTTSITVKKVWKDANNQDGIRPHSINVDLLANGTVVQTVTLNALNKWTATVNNLAKFSNGKPINYTWSEPKVSRYTSVVDGNTITNTHTPATISETVKKVWDDANDQDGIRPSSVTIDLLANGSTVRTVTLNAENHWTATANNLPEYSKGQKINYTWKESNVPTGYISSVHGNTVTNTHQPGKTSITVTKVWKDANNQDGIQPDHVTVILLANGKQVHGATYVLNDANNWSVTVPNLATKINGQTVDYTWQEINVPKDYTSKVNGNEIINTHTPTTISKTVKKVWKDQDNHDVLRPTSVYVILLANGQQVGDHPYVLNVANNLSTTVNDLPKYNKGQKIKYTWQEINVPTGYTSAVNGDTITNTHTPTTPNTISKSVRKVWNDQNNEDGLRPKSIKVDLLNGNSVVTTVTLDSNNGWTATVDKLPATTADGDAINYTWQEINVPKGYTSKVDDDVITNTHTHQQPKLISKTITKVWNDANNQDGLRPDQIHVELLNGNTIVATVVLNAHNHWTATVNNLPEKTADGKIINYTWQEVNVPTGYTSVVNGDTITNDHTPETTSVTVKKVWNDQNNQDDLRPAQVTVDLMNGNKVVQTVTLNSANDWSATVNNLPEYSNGQPITYTWQEVNVPAGYSSTVNGNTITNTHNPTVISLTIQKFWNDQNNQDGLRPTQITVDLLNGNAVVTTVVLDMANNWSATVTNLPEYSNGQIITYTWREANVPAGYVSVVSGNTITNTHTPAVINKSVKKVWNDANNQDGIRPASVTIDLMNGNTVVQTVVLDSAHNWTATVDNLPEFENGQAVTYTWQEVNVPAGYSSAVNGDVITNTHQPTPKPTPQPQPTPKPQVPSQPVHPETTIPLSPLGKQVEHSEPKLPQTGNATDMILSMIGLGLIALTLGLGYYRRQD